MMILKSLSARKVPNVLIGIGEEPHRFKFRLRMPKVGACNFASLVSLFATSLEPTRADRSKVYARIVRKKRAVPGINLAHSTFMRISRMLALPLQD
jgi:hypothetical protein